jgi:hypothetical protein
MFAESEPHVESWIASQEKYLITYPVIKIDFKVRQAVPPPRFVLRYQPQIPISAVKLKTR